MDELIEPKIIILDSRKIYAYIDNKGAVGKSFLTKYYYEQEKKIYYLKK